MVDEQTLLEVLAGVGEVQAPQFDVAAGRVVVHQRREPDQVAAEADREMPDDRVTADTDVVGGRARRRRPSRARSPR